MYFFLLLEQSNNAVLERKQSLFVYINRVTRSWLKKIIWVIGVLCEKDCCLWLTFQQPEQKPSSESSDSLSRLKIQKVTRMKQKV